MNDDRPADDTDVTRKNLGQSAMNDDTLREKLAAIEHERWSSWQEWVHSVAEELPDGRLAIPKNLVERWSRQIATPYAKLSDDEKTSDRNQVDRYWPLVLQYAQAYAESIIGPDKRIGDEIAENRSYTGERMHNAVKAEQRTLNNKQGGKL